MRAAAQPHTSEKIEATLSAGTVATERATRTAAEPSARSATATVTRTLRWRLREGVLRAGVSLVVSMVPMCSSLGLLLVVDDPTRSLEEQRSDDGQGRAAGGDQAHRDALARELGGRPDPAEGIADVPA